ncbi:hypothetical protein [Duganella aquatilis]|nr:hypothetical protein [Duganella aquatilis]
MKKLRDALIVALLGTLIGSAYAYMRQSDEEAALRDQAVWAGKADK